VDNQDASDFVANARERAAAALALYADLSNQVRDHRFVSVAKEAGELRLRLSRIEEQIDSLSAIDSQPRGFWQCLFEAVTGSNKVKRRDLCESREAIRSALSSIEAEEDKLSDHYESLYEQHRKAMAQHLDTHRRYMNAMRPQSDSASLSPAQPATPSHVSSSTDGTKSPDQSHAIRLDRIRAIAARESGRARERAWRIKKKLHKVSSGCVYCGGPLGDNPHADHIYPIAKGGLSIESNMVLVCEMCNVRKGINTLQVFIRTYDLDRDAIEKRLLQQKKDF